MFASLPGFEFNVPPALRLYPAARHWRAIGLTQQPWFIATFKMESNEELARVTLCFSWDTDLVKAARDRSNGLLVEVMCMLPPWRSGTGYWHGVHVTEILEGRDEARGGEQAIAFRTKDGVTLYGPFLEPAGPNLTSLVMVVALPRVSGLQSERGLRTGD